MKKFIVGASSVIASMVYVGLAYAQTVPSTTWTTASTTFLGQQAEGVAATNAYNMFLIILGITLGLAAVFFALRWLWHRIAGRH